MNLLKSKTHQIAVELSNLSKLYQMLQLKRRSNTFLLFNSSIRKSNQNFLKKSNSRKHKSNKKCKYRMITKKKIWIFINTTHWIQPEAIQMHLKFTKILQSLTRREVIKRRKRNERRKIPLIILNNKALIQKNDSSSQVIDKVLKD